MWVARLQSERKSVPLNWQGDVEIFVPHHSWEYGQWPSAGAGGKSCGNRRLRFSGGVCTRPADKVRGVHSSQHTTYNTLLEASSSGDKHSSQHTTHYWKRQLLGMSTAHNTQHTTCYWKCCLLWMSTAHNTQHATGSVIVWGWVQLTTHNMLLEASPSGDDHIKQHTTHYWKRHLLGMTTAHNTQLEVSFFWLPSPALTHGSLGASHLNSMCQLRARGICTGHLHLLCLKHTCARLWPTKDQQMLQLLSLLVFWGSGWEESTRLALCLALLSLWGIRNSSLDIVTAGASQPS